MRKIFLSLAFLLSIFAKLAAQSELGLFFVGQPVQALALQPANVSKKTVVIGLPSVYVHGAHSGFAWRDLVQPLPGSDSLRLDPAGAIAQMGAQNYLGLAGQADLLALSLRISGLQVSAFATTRFQAELSYPRQLAELAWQGNGAFLDQTLAIGPGLAASAWQEIGAGLSLRLLKKLQGGIRLKYLAGLADLRTTRQELLFRTASDGYGLHAEADYELRSSVLNFGSIEQPQFSYEFQPFTGNHGFAADLGIQASLWKDRLQLSASLLDLGAIEWKDRAKTYGARGAVSFEGLDPLALLQADSFSVQQFADSLLSGIELSEAEGSYRAALRPRVYAGGRLKLLKLLRLGALFQGEALGGEFRSAWSLYAGLELGNWLSAGLTGGLRYGQLNQAGAVVYVKPGPFALFVASDNALAFLLPESARWTSLRFGTNLCF
jgi:hypothetical protein